MTGRDYTSSENQKILGKLVEREIIMNASSLVEDLLKADILSYDGIDNLYGYSCINEDCNGEELIGNSENGYQCPNCGCTTVAPEEDGMEGTPKEILEYWFVSEYFYRKLKDKGEAVIDTDYGHIWGRTCSGQAILLDYIIGKIGDEMEILAGQKYSWEDK